jgi:uncharacterized NAD-dependent epimerase/dehydratase family protein
MTAALELTRAARARGMRAAFAASGQTGIMIAGNGIAIDRVIADFASGAAEQIVVEAAAEADLVFVEGQGGINHPAFAPVTLALIYGAAPDALVLVHEPPRSVMDTYGTPLLPYRALIRTYEALCASVKPAKVVGVVLNTRALDEATARAAIASAAEETGLPAADLVRRSSTMRSRRRSRERRRRWRGARRGESRVAMLRAARRALFGFHRLHEDDAEHRRSTQPVDDPGTPTRRHARRTRRS